MVEVLRVVQGLARRLAPPHEFERTLAPSLTALFSAAPRFPKEGEGPRRAGSCSAGRSRARSRRRARSRAPSPCSSGDTWCRRTGSPSGSTRSPSCRPGDRSSRCSPRDRSRCSGCRRRRRSRSWRWRGRAGRAYAPANCAGPGAPAGGALVASWCLARSSRPGRCSSRTLGGATAHVGLNQWPRPWSRAERHAPRLAVPVPTISRDATTATRAGREGSQEAPGGRVVPRVVSPEHQTLPISLGESHNPTLRRAGLSNDRARSGSGVRAARAS